MASPDLLEEISALDSIYPDSILPTASADTYVLKLPFPPNYELRLTFPDSYPDCDAPPEVKGLTPWVVDIARQVLEREWRREVIVFDLVEGLREVLEQDHDGVAGDVVTAEEDSEEEEKVEWEKKVPVTVPKLASSLPPPVWVMSNVVTEKKSVFVARAAKVGSVQEVMHNLHYLLDSDKKVAKATHNILAYRILRPNGTLIQDNDDDGETAAGGRLGHLLSVMKAENVMVIVTRWYGGIKLGGDRFRIINSVGREAVVKLQESG